MGFGELVGEQRDLGPEGRLGGRTDSGGEVQEVRLLRLLRLQAAEALGMDRAEGKRGLLRGFLGVRRAASTAVARAVGSRSELEDRWPPKWLRSKSCVKAVSMKPSCALRCECEKMLAGV